MSKTKKTFDEALWQAWQASHDQYCPKGDRGCPTAFRGIRQDFEEWRREWDGLDKIKAED